MVGAFDVSGVVVKGVSVMLDDDGTVLVTGAVVTSGKSVVLTCGMVLSVTAGASLLGAANTVKDTKTRRITAKSAAKLLFDAFGMTKDPFVVWFSRMKTVFSMPFA